MTVTYLERIIKAHREAAQQDRRDLDDLMTAALKCGPVRDFRGQLESDEAVSVIAEIKRRSPSKGDLRPNLDPASLAREYEQGGAACLSVLTDSDWFGGSPTDLQQARTATALPVLRKDFTIDPRDVLDARIMGADCVLLIVAALTDRELYDYLNLAQKVGLNALVEVNSKAELETALSAGAKMVGVNQRDLVTFEVDRSRAARLVPLMPQGIVRVAESGIKGPEDVARLQDSGYHAVLVGETLVRSANPQAEVRSLTQASTTT